MGLFAKNKTKKQTAEKTPSPALRPQKSKPSFLDPPNTYSSPPPACPPAGHRHPSPHHHHHHCHHQRHIHSHNDASKFQPHFYNQHQPSGRLSAPPPPPLIHIPPFASQSQPVVVNQHFHMSPQHQPPQPFYANPNVASPYGYSRVTGSMVNLAKDLVETTRNEGRAWQGCGTQFLASGAAAYDQLLGRFNDVLTEIDSERMTGDEMSLYDYSVGPSVATPPPPYASPQLSPPTLATNDRAFTSKKPKSKDEKTKQQITTPQNTSYFSKVELYANSKLPLNLPSLALYIPTWPLLCLAAQYSQHVYTHPRGPERSARVSSNWRTGTKAMILKSVALDDVDTIVFAIRGTATFADWAVNLNMSPSAPTNFLDDEGNLCHAGFLNVARKTVRPLAERLRALLEERPGRRRCSLLITGHSAGGAVASLLYMHMHALSKTAESELNLLTKCFKRVHCVTFGTPPVSLLPLQKDSTRSDLKRSLFLSFVNEGDPVVRADKAYVRSLLELLATPAPVVDQGKGGGKGNGEKQKKPAKDSKEATSPRPKKSKSKLLLAAPSPPQKPTWPVPPSTLSNPGRIVILRSGALKSSAPSTSPSPQAPSSIPARLSEGVIAQTCTDAQLRGVIWGDPVAHMMSLYAGRIETLAVGAVTAKSH